MPPGTLGPFSVKKSYTHKQGEYFASIYYYTKVNGRAPSEADMQKYFGVTPPSVHQTVVTLEANGFGMSGFQGRGGRSVCWSRVRGCTDLE